MVTRFKFAQRINHTLYKPHGELKVVNADAPVTKNQLWDVEKILDNKKMRNGKTRYLVKSTDFEEPTWETQDNLRLINKNKMSASKRKYFNNIGK